MTVEVEQQVKQSLAKSFLSANVQMCKVSYRGAGLAQEVQGNAAAAAAAAVQGCCFASCLLRP